MKKYTTHADVDTTPISERAEALFYTHADPEDYVGEAIVGVRMVKGALKVSTCNLDTWDPSLCAYWVNGVAIEADVMARWSTKIDGRKYRFPTLTEAVAFVRQATRCAA